MNRRRDGGAQAKAKAFSSHCLSPDNVALIREIYRQDFELFGYSLEVPEPPPPPVSAQPVAPVVPVAPDRPAASAGGGASDAGGGGSSGPDAKRARMEGREASSWAGGGRAAYVAGPPAKAQSLQELLAAYKAKK